MARAHEQRRPGPTTLTKPTQPSLSSQRIRELLLKRFAAPEWVTVFEVAPSTGGGTGYADAIAVNLWSSRGHAIHGFEIKVSRADWLRELKRPQKSAPVLDYCDRWWLVAPTGVMQPGELPATWGYMEAKAQRLIARVDAPRLKPRPIDRPFFASLARRSFEGVNETVRAALASERAALQPSIDARVAEEVSRRARQHEALKTAVAEFEGQTGISLRSGYAGTSIRTVKLAQELERLDGWGHAGRLGKLTELVQSLDRAAAIVRSAIAVTGLAGPQEESKQPAGGDAGITP